VLLTSYSKDHIRDSYSRLAIRYAKEYSIPRIVIYNKKKFIIIQFYKQDSMSKANYKESGKPRKNIVEILFVFTL